MPPTFPTFPLGLHVDRDPLDYLVLTQSTSPYPESSRESSLIFCLELTWASTENELEKRWRGIGRDIRFDVLSRTDMIKCSEEVLVELQWCRID